VATIKARETSSPSSVHTRNGRFDMSSLVASAATKLVPNLVACFLNSSIISGPCTPSGKPG
jgi:hypothetical protein